MLAPLSLNQAIQLISSRPISSQPISMIMAGVCAIGFIAGGNLICQQMASAFETDHAPHALLHTPNHDLSQSFSLQPSRSFEPADDLGLPSRREPGGTR
ncbi:MAG: hypothetical protein AAGD25_39065 [Cyanobacteria bacterium P01_F01_bin.150]